MKINTKPMNFRDRNLVFIDLEMTGLDPAIHEITEIGCLVVNRNLEILTTYEQKVKPLHIETADPVAIELTGYTNEKWNDAISLSEALTEVNKLATDAMFVGWNVIADWLFLEKGFLQHKIEPLFDYHLIDAMSVAYTKFLPLEKPDGLNLRKIAEYYQLPMGQLHGALEDATATYEVFKKLMEK
jgi:DNA polymerase III alpha subunit (gram-positive type)